MIARKLECLRDAMRVCCLACGRPPENVTLVAVSKTKSEALIRQACAAGQHVFGENYVQEVATKAENLQDLPLSWHFIGHLQRNKARIVVRFCDLIHSVDSLRLAQELNRHAEAQNKIQKILIQIHLGGEASKSGLPPEELLSSLKDLRLMSHLDVQGLMTIPPPVIHPEDNRTHFRTLKHLMQDANGKSLLPAPMHILSMGMTDDFRVAIEEGATHIRVGTAIFGARNGEDI